MRKWNIAASISCNIICILFFSSSPAKENTLLLSDYCTGYRAATQNELQQAKTIFNTLFTRQPIDAKKISLNNFRAKELNIAQQEIIYLIERREACDGRGDYAIRYGKTIPILLQAPHRFSDVKTGLIIKKMFMEAPYKSAAWNNAKRKTIDLAHTQKTLFNTFAQSFLQQIPQGIIIQLHGFSNSRRTSAVGKKAAIIISEGRNNTSANLDNLTQCLRQIKQNTYQYPKMVNELGATTNTLGRWVNKHHPGHFIHIECNKKTREQLLKDKAIRKKLTQCLKQLVLKQKN